MNLSIGVGERHSGAGTQLHSIVHLTVRALVLNRDKNVIVSRSERIRFDQNASRYVSGKWLKSQV